MLDMKRLKQQALEIRRLTIEEIGNFGSGHIGGSMSIVEVLTYLYYEAMRIDPSNPRKEDRDRFVCSKGHAGPAVYATLASKGYFNAELLKTLNSGGTNLPSHCDMNKTVGVDFTAGSLGQGFSAAVGIALGQKIKGLDARTYAIIGDGESQEGQIWEMGMFAAQYKLDNLIAFMDFNKLQIDGTISEVIELENIEQKWNGFGWHVQRVDGHDLEALKTAVLTAKMTKGQPSMIICDTIKAKGFSPAQGKVTSHHMAVSKEMIETAIRDLFAE